MRGGQGRRAGCCGRGCLRQHGAKLHALHAPLPASAHDRYSQQPCTAQLRQRRVLGNSSLHALVEVGGGAGERCGCSFADGVRGNDSASLMQQLEGGGGRCEMTWKGQVNTAGPSERASLASTPPPSLWRLQRQQAKPKAAAAAQSSSLQQMKLERTGLHPQQKRQQRSLAMPPPLPHKPHCRHA